jgi:predicted secreted hydrolase
MAALVLPKWQDLEDTLHPYDNPEYYEWWYFDSRFDNGYSCVATFHWRNPFTFPHRPTVQVFIYSPDGEKNIGMAAIDEASCSSATQRCDVSMGQNYARQEGNTYVIHMAAKLCGVDLVYERELPGWKQNGDGYLFNGVETKQGWVIAAPRSKVNGTLHIRGKDIPVSGTGYHDKNWGNTDIDKSFSGWYWGRLYDSEFTLIYYRLFPSNEQLPVISRLLLARNGIPLAADGSYDFKVVKEETCNVTGRKIPAMIEISSTAKSPVPFHCSLATTSILERDRLPAQADQQQFHWRFLGDYSLSAEIGGKAITGSGKALHEHLVFK